GLGESRVGITRAVAALAAGGAHGLHDCPTVGCRANRHEGRAATRCAVGFRDTPTVGDRRRHTATLGVDRSRVGTRSVRAEARTRGLRIVETGSQGSSANGDAPEVASTGSGAGAGTLTAERPLLEVKDLRTWFATPNGVVKAVDGVSFTLERGSTLGVVGESGCGKTVLSRSILNLLPRTNVVRHGAVQFEGKDLVGLDDAALGKMLGPDMAMVSQDPMTSLHPVMRVGNQITDVLRLPLGMSRREAEETAVGLLRSVRIPEPERRLREYPHQLSGGMRQRVMIAIAIA